MLISTALDPDSSSPRLRVPPRLRVKSPRRAMTNVKVYRSGNSISTMSEFSRTRSNTIRLPSRETSNR